MGASQIPEMNSFAMTAPAPFDLEATAKSHGWVNLAPFQWCPVKRALQVTLALSGELVKVQVRAGPSDGTLLVNSSLRTGKKAAAALRSRLERILMLDVELTEASRTAEELEPRVAEALRAGAGRLLRGATFFEDAAKTVLTINTSWENTVSMVRSLVDGLGAGAFPAPVAIARAGVDSLRRIAPLGYRARTLVTLAEQGLDARWFGEDGDLHSAPPTKAELLSVWGIGPYAATHIRVLSGDFEFIPVDSEVKAHMAHQFGSADKDPNVIYERWGRHRFVGYKLNRMLERTNWIGD